MKNVQNVCSTDNNAKNMKSEVIILKSFEDNYIYLLEYAEGLAVAVDPGEARPVLDELHERKLKLTHVLVTHRHGDHTGGIAELGRQMGSKVVAGADENIGQAAIQMRDGEKMDLAGMQVRSIATPGHTGGSVCWYCSGGQLKTPVVFTGDTLFVCGCGRVFEGDGQTMLRSLRKLAELPDETLVYPGHEYTEENVRFAMLHNPAEQRLKEKLKEVRAMMAQGRPTVPGTMAFEKQFNPFLTAPDAKTFTKLRNEKNTFD